MSDELTRQIPGTDCKTSPHETELYDYPNPRKGWSHVNEKFGPASTFNFNPEEIVALIGGAHSLGKMHPENSGFEKAWDSTEYVCDNYSAFKNFGPAPKFDHF